MIYSGYEEAHQNAPELAGAPWISKPALHPRLVSAAAALIAQAERLIGVGASLPITQLPPSLVAHQRERASEEPWW
jgi:hypothetical protein